MKIRDIVGEGRGEIYTITPENTVHEAIQKLVHHNIGALPVCSADDDLVGIVTERDILRLCARQDCHEMLQLKVSDVMTRDLVIGVPDDDLEYVLHVMTNRRIRHMPVLERRRLVGIVSIGDAVKAKLDESSAEIHFLRDYLTH